MKLLISTARRVLTEHSRSMLSSQKALIAPSLVKIFEHGNAVRIFSTFSKRDDYKKGRRGGFNKNKQDKEIDSDAEEGDMRAFVGQTIDEWDEEKYGPVDSEDWQGFDGDLDAVTEEGVPTWLESVRRLNAIEENEKLDEKLARRALEEAKMTIVRVRKVDELGRAYGTGRRKTSTARVWVKESTTPYDGKIAVNKKDFVDYFVRETHREDILRPFSVLDKIGHFDVYCTVKGGGLTGQAGAIRHGISQRFLQNFNPDFRPALKKEGFLTRDPRMVERKKPGQPKARKKFQWVKR